MNVTRNVIEDLLPVYLAGEASADTRALMEQFLAADPDFAREVERQKQQFTLPAIVASSAAPADAERLALERTRAHLRKRSRLLAFAIFFTGLPFAFVFDHGRITWMMWRNAPTESLIFLLCGLSCWVGWIVGGRKLRNAGL
jgi:ferric-dicitrate binding protein FerR (iron transport regulator)